LVPPKVLNPDFQDQPSKTLILHSGGIGDLLLALPAMRIFRQSFPSSILEVMGRPERLSLIAFDLQSRAVHSIDQAGMAYFYLEGEPLPVNLSAFFSSFKIVLAFGKSGGGTLGENLEKTGIERVISIPSFPTGEMGIHVSDYLIQSLRNAGFEGKGGVTPLVLPGEALSMAQDFWSRMGLKEEEKVLAIHPGSGSPGKNWHPKSFAEVADRASERARILLISGPAQDGVGEVRRTLKRADAGIANNIPLIQLAALLKRCTAYLGNDSGITHLAASLGIPTLAIFGPTDPAVWGARGTAVQTLYARESCSPCFHEGRSDCKRHCLEKIKPSDVMRVLESYLA
jgi:ADP-heptose:LPS heptosyltransferase